MSPGVMPAAFGDLKTLQTSVLATTEERFELIERERLQDLGCGAVDISLLASILLTPDALLWTVDKNLGALAKRFNVAFPVASK